MALKIYWTDFAKNQLQNIFNYYKDKTSLSIAKKLVIGITKETLELQKQPIIGQIEESLKNPTREFRYLVFKNYKIIYFLNSEKNTIEIFDVFDSRQSPFKIKRTK